MSCNFCGKDCCATHRTLYWEGGGQDYPDFCACAECQQKVNKCEHIAHSIAGRYEDWYEVVRRVYDNFDEYQHLLEDYQEPSDEQPINTEDLYI